METITLEFRHVATDDGLALPALLWKPIATNSRRIGALFVHGKTGCLTQKHLTNVAETLAIIGIPSICANNRGAYEAGSAREFFDDCILDIEAAARVLYECGCEKIIVLGHSYGGLKSAFYASVAAHSLAGLVLMSSIPHLKISAEQYQLASERAASGEGEAIFSKKEGDWLQLYQANALIKNYEKGYQGSTVDLLVGAAYPILSFAATDEWGWFHEVTLTLPYVLKDNAQLDCRLVEGLVDHNYSGKEREVASLVRDWVATRIL